MNEECVWAPLLACPAVLGWESLLGEPAVVPEQVTGLAKTVTKLPE
jgi:hypothetical protein